MSKIESKMAERKRARIARLVFLFMLGNPLFVLRSSEKELCAVYTEERKHGD